MRKLLPGRAWPVSPRRRAPYLAAALAVAAVGTASGATAERWWSHVRTLADDSMQGRLTGTPEHRRAAVYVAGAFEEAGLRPGGTDGYFQPLRFRSRRLDEARSFLTVQLENRSYPLTLGTEAMVGLRYEPAERVEAPLVFAGYGLVVPEADYDDLAGLDVNGRIVVYVAAAPPGLTGAQYSHHQSAAERWRALRSRGAVGMIAIRPGAGQDVPWERAAAARLAPVLTPEAPDLQDTPSLQLALTVNELGARTCLRGSNLDVETLLERAEARQPLPRQALPGRLSARLAIETREVVSDNVLGILPGADPEVSTEQVVLTAHLDHVGADGRPEGDGVHNGAMDNASGVATLLETAARFRAAGVRPRRTLVFAAVTAEEQGLLGSKHLALQPPVPGAPMVANVNVDMFLPLYPMTSVIAIGAEESDLGEDARAVAHEQGLALLADPEPERRSFVRSDQYSFIRSGIPALALKVGYAKDTPEHEILKRWRRDRYHAPADDLEQPVDLAAADRFNGFYAALVMRIANRESRPEWHETSAFRRLAPAAP